MKPAWAQAFSVLGLLLATAVCGQSSEMIDRVVAVVEEEPILESDLDRVIGLGLAEPGEGEDDQAFRRRVLDQVIEEKLRFHEIDRFGFSEISLADVDRAYADIRSRFRNRTAFDETLSSLDMTAEELKQLVARQLMVLTYVDERLGSRVFVSGDDIQLYYDETLVPSLKARRKPVPTFADVREEIRAVLKEVRLNQEIASWTEELRQEADIDDYFADQNNDLPPIVLGTEGN